MQKLYTDKLDEGLSPRRVRLIHATLHRALNQAVKWGMAARNIADAVTPPRVERNETQVLTPEEARKLLGAAQGTAWRPCGCWR